MTCVSPPLKGHNGLYRAHLPVYTTLCFVAVTIQLFSTVAGQSPRPSPSPAPSTSWQGSISTGYLAVVFGMAFVLVSFIFCTSYCIRIWFVRWVGPREAIDQQQDEGGSPGDAAVEPPPPPGPPPVVVIQPDRVLSCASVADEHLQEELARKYSLASRESSRFVEVMLDQDENGDLQVKQGSLNPAQDGTSDSSAPPRTWLVRVWGACFRRNTGNEDVQGRSTDDLELGSVTPSSRSVVHGGRRRSVLQQHTVTEEEPAPLQVQWSGPSVSELRHETDTGEAVLTAVRSVGDGDLGNEDAAGGSSGATASTRVP